MGDGVRIHKSVSDDDTSYITLDHNKQEAIHKSIIVKHEAGDRLPFAHETQEAVERIDHPKLGKGFATDVTYLHFMGSDLPLSSSDVQQIGGYKMWRRLAHRAHNNGNHVYLWDNSSNKLTHLDTIDKINSGLDIYFSTEPRTKDFGHIVLSKSKIS